MRSLIFIITCFLSTATFAQHYKIKKITPKSFDLTKYGNDTIYDAIVEYNIGNSFFSISSKGQFTVVHETKKRIHILEKDGYHYGDITIPLYKKNRDETEVLEIKDAYTYNLVDGKVVRTKLDDKEIYESKHTGNTWTATFSMPNVKEGSIIEYTTKVTSSFYHHIPEWYFQQEIPVKYSEHKFVIPERMIFLNYTKGNIKLKQSVIDGGYIYSASDIPAMVTEEHTDNIDNYRSSVAYLYNGFRKKTGRAVTYSGDWPEVIKTIHEHNQLGGQLNDIEFCKAKTEELVKDLTHTKDKIDAILTHIQQNYYWNKTLSIGAKQKLEDVYKHKNGNSAEINMLMIAFLQNAKIMAYPVVLSSVGHGMIHLPHVDAFDQLIVGVQLGEQIHLLDATNKYSELDVVPLHNLNRTGRIVINENKSSDISLAPQKVSKSQLNAYLELIEGSNNIRGVVRENSTFYKAFETRNFYDGKTDSEVREMFENYLSMTIDSLKIENKSAKNRPLKEYYSFTREKSFDIINEKIYLSPAFVFGINESPFKQQNRQYPIYYPYPSNKTYHIVYDIPEGYEVDFVPESKITRLSDNSLEFSWVILHDDNKIKISIEQKIYKRYIEPAYYQSLKTIYEDYLNFINSKIVLKKSK